MRYWWCKRYTRPLKDATLLSYTTTELLYEYHEVMEREVVAQEQAEREDDNIDKKKVDETLDWAEREEKAEMEQLEKAKATAEAMKKPAAPVVADPMEDPANKEWVEKQLLAEAKQLYGDDFGEDIDQNFSE